VFVQTAHGDKVLMPGVSAEEHDRVKELAEAGDIRAPEIAEFIRGFAELVGVDLDATPWGDHDTVGFLTWLGFIPEEEWTRADDAGLELLLREGAGDGR
jgi:hypothetical protein